MSRHISGWLEVLEKQGAEAAHRTARKIAQAESERRHYEEQEKGVRREEPF
jgi:hypothetical protein